jgi:hypothetical protein
MPERSAVHITGFTLCVVSHIGFVYQTALMCSLHCTKIVYHLMNIFLTTIHAIKLKYIQNALIFKEQLILALYNVKAISL